MTCIAVAVAGCESTGDPPVSEWSRAPLRPDDARSDAQIAHGSGRNGLRLGGGGAGRTETVVGSGRFVGSSRARRKAEDAAEDEGVTLNLANLPIAEAAKVVLGDIVGADYVVDPRLEGKVTVHTSRPVKKSVAIELFQSSLRVAGAAVVESDGIYKIVPADQAATSGAPLSIGAGAAPRASEQIGNGVRVVQLRYVSASEMKRVLEPISQRGGIVQADESRRILTLSGSAHEVAALEEAITIFDVDAMRGMSFAMVPVRSGDPDTLAEDLRKVFGSEKEGPMNGMIQFVGNKHLAAILVISPQRAYLSRARAWIDRLDARAESTEKQFFSYRVQNRPAKEMVRVLSTMFGRDSGGSGNDASPRFGQSSTSSGGALSQSGSSGGSSSGLGSLGSSSGSGGLGSGGFGLNSSSNSSSGSNSSSSSGSGSASSGGVFGASKAGAAGSASGDQNGSQSGSGQDAASSDDGRFKFAVDEAKNAIVVMATPEDYKRLLKVVETLDVLPNQVFIEATIAEVTLTDDLTFGVRWFLQKNASAGAFSDGDTGTPGANDATTGSNLLGAAVGATFPGFNYALRAANTQVTLSALNKITNVNIISTPSLTVLDNRQAVLQVGDQVPVQTYSGTNTSGGVTTFNSVTYRDTGVILSITPHINESGRVMLELEQEVSNVAAGTSATSTTPTIKQRRVKTQVVVNDSEALMLGGLIQDSSSRGASQIPIVGDIPILGNAFKSKSNNASKTELLIMITPHVVRSLAEARDITDEFKRKMLRISTKAIVRPHGMENTARRILLDQ
nr:type II secretion system secretin GspD [Methylosinus sp. Sm6]